jgi:hypothetical protein
MRDKIDTIKRLSAQRKERAQAAQTAASIRSMTGRRPRVPIRSQSVEWTEEGLTTPLADPEPVGASFTLPAKSLEWAFKPGRYRLLVRTGEENARLTLTDKDNTIVVRDHQAFGRAILDVNISTARLESTKPVTDIEIYRFTRQMQGSAVIGPFEARGVVRAEARGDGNWSAEVASEPMIPGSVTTDGREPSFDRTGSPWRGTPPSETQPSSPGGDAVPWATARRFPAVGAELDFYQAVRAGDVRAGHETKELQSTTSPDGGGLWWPRLQEWRVLGSHRAPSFDPRPGLWTNVWGTARGEDKAWDLRTGRPADARDQGPYLIRTDDPESVEISGAWGAEGEPVPGADKNALPAGTYGHARLEAAPNRVYVRLEGTGTAGHLELEMTRRLGPAGLEVTDQRQVDLKKYFGEKGQADSSGRGRLLSTD